MKEKTMKKHQRNVLPVLKPQRVRVVPKWPVKPDPTYRPRPLSTAEHLAIANTRVMNALAQAAKFPGDRTYALALMARYKERDTLRALLRNVAGHRGGCA